MQYLVLLRGAPASGKSTFIKKYHLEPYTLCSDQIRTQVCSPVLNTDGNFVISQKQDKYVWETLYTMLEKRMQDGCFTVVDATHYKTSLINPYKNLVKRYGYRTYIIDFTDVPYDELVKRNNEREYYKRVPEEVIKKMVTCFTDDTEIRKWCTVIKPEEFGDTFTIKPIDLTEKYDQIYVFGDIHGCYTCFKNFIDKHPLTDRTCYIFVGDYTDRGLENKEMVQWLLDNYQKPNVVLLKSNHTVHLDHYANDEWDLIRSKEFKQTTYKQLEGFDKKDLRQLCRKFIQMSYFKMGNNRYLVTHGGVPNITEYNLVYIPTIQFIKGVGEYSDCDKVDECWTNRSIAGYYSIHGHRNVCGVKIHNTKLTYNLDSRIEYGEPLRVIRITKDGVTNEYEEPNPIYLDPKKEMISSRILDIHSDIEVINELNNNRDIIKKELGDGYYSFNFSRDVFYKKKWNDLTEIARGLFVHLPDGKIVARSYKKFFNLNENKETSLENVYRKVQYPIVAYHKYNGYLGLLSYDFVNDDFFIATKSTNQGDYKNWFKKILEDKKYLTQKLKEYLKKYNCTFIFEVIDPINDLHIIKYKYKEVILLDIIYNEFQFRKDKYFDMASIAQYFGFLHKEVLLPLYNLAELEDFLKNFDNNYALIEGAVFEDANGYMFKYKTSYYKFWKEMRKLKDEFAKGRVPKKIYKDEQWISFYKFLEKLTPEELSKDIITLRTKWREEK